MMAPCKSQACQRMFIKKGLQEWSLNPSSSIVGDIIIIIIIVYLNSEM